MARSVSVIATVLCGVPRHRFLAGGNKLVRQLPAQIPRSVVAATIRRWQTISNRANDVNPLPHWLIRTVWMMSVGAAAKCSRRKERNDDHIEVGRAHEKPSMGTSVKQTDSMTV